MADDLDPTPYVRPPLFDVPSGVALGIALLAASPKPAPDNVKKAAKKVHKDTLALQAAWAKADAAPTPVDRRKADMRVDNAWGMMLDRLESYASLPALAYPKAARARVLVDTLAKDREWLNMPFGAEWAESGKRLKRIEDDGLAADIDALAGPEFLEEVQNAHQEYGIALGVTEALPASPQVSLADPLRALSRSIARYGIAVVGMVDDEPETLAVVRKALRPIDDHREGQARRANAGAAKEEPAAPKVTPSTPVPEPA